MERVVMSDFVVVYPDFTLGPISFSLASGERVALIGQNGAGKSTTLRGLVGLVARYGGSVKFEGREMRDGGPALRSAIGMMPERLLGFGWMTVSEHLNFLARFYPTWDRAYAAELGRRLGLPGGTRLANLSKGMSSKLAFVAAEAYRPTLLILDEPTSGLDPVMRTEILSMIDECAPRSGERIVVFSSHILEDVEAAADRVLLLREGRLLLDTSLDDLRRGRREEPLTRVILERLHRA